MILNIIKETEFDSHYTSGCVIFVKDLNLNVIERYDFEYH